MLPAASSSWITTEAPPLDVEQILSTLTPARGRVLLVGGVAAIAHGARRLTVDLDCVALKTYDKSRPARRGLRDLNARRRTRRRW